MTYAELLQKMVDDNDALEAARLRYEAQRDAILAPVRLELAALEGAYQVERLTLAAQVDETRALLTEAVLDIGETVKNERLQVQFVKGRITWDTKKLDGYAAAHPELLAFRKEGEPSVRFVFKGA